MKTRIRRLSCRVTVKSGNQSSLFHKSEGLQRPTLAFAASQSNALEEEHVVSSHTGQQGNEEPAGDAQTGATKRQADTRAVADRVYELMQQEVRLNRLRAGGSL